MVRGGGSLIGIILPLAFLGIAFRAIGGIADQTRRTLGPRRMSVPVGGRRRMRRSGVF